VIDGISYRRCPLTEVDTGYYWFIKAYNYLDKGILPNSGGWMDQSKRFIDMMSFMINIVAEHQQEQVKKYGTK